MSKNKIITKLTFKKMQECIASIKTVGNFLSFLLLCTFAEQVIYFPNKKEIKKMFGLQIRKNSFPS